uniref:Uncharacterized protein n=1 Tax=Arundo donax TaxID=35708 RepID=A0A0A9APG7_ARUDO
MEESVYSKGQGGSRGHKPETPEPSIADENPSQILQQNGCAMGEPDLEYSVHQWAFATCNHRERILLVEGHYEV